MTFKVAPMCSKVHTIGNSAVLKTCNIARREIQIVDARRRQKQKKGVRCFELFGFHKRRFEAPF